MTDLELYDIIDNYITKAENELKETNDHSEKTVLELYDICKKNEFRKFKNMGAEFGFLVYYADSLTMYYELLRKDFLDENGFYKEQILIDEQKENLNKDLKKVDKTIEILNKTIEICDKALKSKFTPFHYDMKTKIYFPNIMQIRKQRAFYTLGNLYAFYKDVPTAIQYLEKAKELGNVHAITFLIYIYTREEYLNIDKAIEYYQSILDFNGSIKNNGEKYHIMNAFATLFSFYYNSGLFDNARELFKNLKKTFETKDPVWVKELDNVLHNDKEFKKIFQVLSEKNKNTEILDTYFSNKVINKMSEEVKIFLLTSLKVKDFIEKTTNEEEILDFSAATMPAMKALENVLFDIFAKNYLKYLNEKFLENEKYFDFNLIDDKLVYIDKNNNTKKQKLRKTIDNLELGTILKWSAINKFYNQKLIRIPNDYFLDFCEKFCNLPGNFKSVQDFVSHFIETIYEIKQLRNLSAHKGRVTKNDSDNAFKYLIKQYKFINLLYEVYYDIL